LDRFPDRNGNYEPGNVRWATDIEQARNTRTNVFIAIGEETKTLVEWSQIFGTPLTVYYRRVAAGSTPAEAVSGGRNDKHRYITFNGKTQTLMEWAKETGIAREAIAGRLNRGASVDKALTIASGEIPLRRTVTIDGQTRYLADWLKHFGMREATFRTRICTQGMTEAEALTKPVAYRSPRKPKHLTSSLPV
jgi:hypothetical protein